MPSRRPWRAHRSAALAPSLRADAQGKRADRRNRRSIARRSVRSPTSRSSWSEFRRAGRHRHREHAPAQRAARIAAAADRDRRRAQGHQPLDVRSAGGVRHTCRVGRAALPCRQGSISRCSTRTAFSMWPHVASTPTTTNTCNLFESGPIADRSIGSNDRSKAKSFRSTTYWPIRNSPRTMHRSSGASAVPLAFRCYARERQSGSYSSRELRWTHSPNKQIELVTNVRRPGRNRHREHAPAQRAARAPRFRIVAAADRHRRRAQGHQRLSLRSAACPEHHCRNRSAPLQRRICCDLPVAGWTVSFCSVQQCRRYVSQARRPTSDPCRKRVVDRSHCIRKENHPFAGLPCRS